MSTSSSERGSAPPDDPREGQRTLATYLHQPCGESVSSIAFALVHLQTCRYATYLLEPTRRRPTPASRRKGS